MRKHLCKLLLLAATLVMPVMTQGQSLEMYSFATGTDTALWIDIPTTTTSLITPGGGMAESPPYRTLSSNSRSGKISTASSR